MKQEMRKFNQISKNQLRILGLSVLLSVSWAPPAHAVFGVGDIVFDPIAFGKLVLAEAQNAANSAIKAFGDNLQASLGIRNTQAVVDATDRAALTKAQMDNAAKHMIPDNNGSCSHQTLAQNAAAAKAGGQSLANAMGNPNQTTGTTPAESVKAACDRGNISATENPDLNALNSNCTQDSSRPERVNADVNYATVSRNNSMSFPSGITAGTNGVLSLPAAKGLPPAQQDFIDAYSVCVNSLPHDPPNMANIAGGGKPTIAVLAVDTQRLGKLKRTPAFNDCTKEVMRNTAVSSGVAGALGGQYQILHDAQAKACKELVDQGIAPASTNCDADGMSDAKIDQLKLQRYGTDYPSKYLLAKRSITPENINILAEQHIDNEMMINLLREISSSLKAINMNTMPNNSIPGPTGMEQTVK